MHNKVIFDINEIQFWRLMVDVKNLAKELNTKLYFRVILDIRKEPKDKKHQLKFLRLLFINLTNLMKEFA